MTKTKIKKPRKFKWKRFIAIVCVCIVSLGCVGLLGSIFKDDNTRKISASAFSVGSLDENGKYVENDQAIFTEEAFACQGLRIKPDFKAKLVYDVYYYDYDENLVEAITGLSEVYDEDNPLATFCRIVIHPDVPADEDGKDFSINFLEVRKYAKQLTITVNKEQPYADSKSVNLYDNEAAQVGSSLTFSGGQLVIAADGSCKISSEINVEENYEYFDIYVKKMSSNNSIIMAGIINRADNSVATYTTYSMSTTDIGEFCKVTLKVPADVSEDAYLIVRTAKDAVCCVYGYN